MQGIASAALQQPLMHTLAKSKGFSNVDIQSRGRCSTQKRRTSNDHRRYWRLFNWWQRGTERQMRLVWRKETEWARFPSAHLNQGGLTQRSSGLAFGQPLTYFVRVHIWITTWNRMRFFIAFRQSLSQWPQALVLSKILQASEAIRLIQKYI